MTFFLLKWVFNAIKRDSAEDDPAFKGASYVSKADFIKQLGKNPEILRALGYDDPVYLRDSIKLASSAKEGYLTWGEFLDFFFAKETSLQDRDDGEAWWNKLDREGRALPAVDKLMLDEEENDQKSKMDKTGGMSQTMGLLSPQAQRELDDKRPVALTESLKVLQNAREAATNAEVTDEFRKLEEEKRQRAGGKAAPKKKSKVPEYDSLAMMGDGYEDSEDDGLFKREKSKNLLLASQTEAMKAVFDKLDKYEENILRRSEFVMALRTDTVVIDFIDCEAVQKAYSTKTLTLDAVFMEIERDEKYEQPAVVSKKNDDINHKEFITWREFLNYFNDFKEIEDRNRKGPKAGVATKKEDGQEGDEEDEGDEKILSLIDKEKERRLKELPRLRPADQIDITEKQLQVLRNLFDSLPRVQTNQEGRDAVQQLSFFTTIRKDP
jgi:hypothetical protein